ncbi:hypothetical protein J7T55_006030 [Diaporthe amygdali]|uniref:uncharacterized protein n=1 Tax=Phomopsis amygdali TaxID=1214568 RepID=UPI0022FDD2FB|nr:uncharacterized protein J7T55_006030 [Diaporthe amygdali]KAJ0124689.1 hypothetical protein J7T55_006030 [Diaporthe amygdali]
MVRLNHDTWQQPPASLSVEWPTKSSFKEGPSLEEQKARMRETRTKVSNAIAASGYAVPQWPEIGQQVKWNPPKTSLRDGLTNLTSHPGGHSSSVASHIPRRYRTSTAEANAQNPLRFVPGEEGRSSIDHQDSPVSQLVSRRQERSQQAESATADETLPDQDVSRIRGFIDPSILNPQINVVELPDHMFLRPPPAAPRAMLERMSSKDRSLRFGRSRGHSDATATSFGSAHTCRARCYSSATTDTRHSFEPTLSDCNDEHSCSDVYDSSKRDVPHMNLETPNLARAHSSAITKTGTYQVLDTPRISGPPPGFERCNPINQGVIPRPGFGNLDSEPDNRNGTWSQSRIWCSEEERLRVNFARMLERAHHLGWNKSPFLPESVGEYAALLAERKAEEAKRIRKKIKQNERVARLRREEEVMVSHRSQLINANCLFFGEALIDQFVQKAPPPQQQIELFQGKKVVDGLSSVLAMESCFNEIPADAPESERVEWPPDEEFRNWRGSRPRPPPGFARWRSSSHRGAWPFPRTNVPYRPQDTFPNNDIPYSQRRMVFAPRWDWMPKFAKTTPDESHIPVAEPFTSDISKFLPANLV